ARAARGLGRPSAAHARSRAARAPGARRRGRSRTRSGASRRPRRRRRAPPAGAPRGDRRSAPPRPPRTRGAGGTRSDRRSSIERSRANRPAGRSGRPRAQRRQQRAQPLLEAPARLVARSTQLRQRERDLVAVAVDDELGAAARVAAPADHLELGVDAHQIADDAPADRPPVWGDAVQSIVAVEPAEDGDADQREDEPGGEDRSDHAETSYGARPSESLRPASPSNRALPSADAFGDHRTSRRIGTLRDSRARAGTAANAGRTTVGLGSTNRFPPRPHILIGGSSAIHSPP